MSHRRRAESYALRMASQAEPQPPQPKGKLATRLPFEEAIRAAVEGKPPEKPPERPWRKPLKPG